MMQVCIDNISFDRYSVYVDEYGSNRPVKHVVRGVDVYYTVYSEAGELTGKKRLNYEEYKTHEIELEVFIKRLLKQELKEAE